MTDMEAMEAKARCLREINEYLPSYRERLDKIDVRLTQYAYFISDKEKDHANLYELLGLRKFLRMMDTYPFDYDKVHRVFRAYEGMWKEHKYIEGSGGLMFSGMNGRTHYELTPMQIMELAAPFGFMISKNDWRRVCREATYFVPRKASKTTLSAFFQTWFFLFEDVNAEIYCCANSQDQSKILFKLTYELIRQLDPKEQRIRFTNTEINWRPGQQRECKIQALTAGGKAKDGLFAQLCCADEYGSATFVKDKSDMANLLQVVEGSMGPRREPLTVITTTAGRVNEGPFELKLRGMKDELMRELTVPLDGRPHPMDADWQYALICCPDQWEQDEVSLQDPRVWQKVNHHIGVTVQPDFYENEWKRMRMDDEKKREQVCKLFNVFQSDRLQEWINPDIIRKLQIPRRIDDLDSSDGWIAYCGMDFSKGNDLNAQSYLCYNQVTGEFFADMDAWVTEETLNTNTNAAMYRQLLSSGHLHVCPGKVIDENMVTGRIVELSDRISFVRIGYDAFDAKRFINNLSLWVYSQGHDPKDYIRPVSQTYGSYNSPVQELEYMVKAEPPMIHFSDNPMWPWQFNNCYLDEDPRNENKKPIKKSSNAKVDNVQCLLTCIILHDQLQGSEVQL